VDLKNISDYAAAIDEIEKNKNSTKFIIYFLMF
jgi:hypothetical protein